MLHIDRHLFVASLDEAAALLAADPALRAPRHAALAAEVERLFANAGGAVN